MVSWELQINGLVCNLIQNLLCHPGLQCGESFVSSILVLPVVTYRGWFQCAWLGYLHSAAPSVHITPILHVDLALLVICLAESTKSCWAPGSICRARRSTTRHSPPYYCRVLSTPWGIIDKFQVDVHLVVFNDKRSYKSAIQSVIIQSLTQPN